MIRIVTDSMSDVSQEQSRAYHIDVLPQPIRFGEEEFWDDGVSITQEEFYKRIRVATELPKTSQVPMVSFLDAFNSALEDPENQVLCITGSSLLSGCYQSACLAKESCADPDRVTVIDSLNATCAETLLVEEAVLQRDAGKTVAEIAERIEDIKSRHKIIGMADDLKYLVMGGRLSPLVGKVGTALHIKPTLKIEGGVIDKAGVVRGNAKGRAWYIEQLKLFPPDKSIPLYIGGADCPDAVALIREQIEAEGLDLPEIREVNIGCLIGTHVGPGLTLISWAIAK
ncbi:MAG: DegV family protein [Christensenellaceae bacterium]|nr:DegV family protein [Christensenellaceae bacterium]